MRARLFILIVGFVLWIASEAIEMLNHGYTPTVYYLTSAYHLFAGIGFWGLHSAQSRGGYRLSLVATGMVSASYLALTYFPIAVMRSGLTPPEMIDAVPFYKIVGIVNLIGFIAFGVAVLLKRVFPAWTGVLIILGNVVFMIALTQGLRRVVNINSIVFALVILFMAIFAWTRSAAPDGTVSRSPLS